jgi:hypothetical protein
VGDKAAKLAKSSGTSVQKNSLRGCDPQVVNVPNFLEDQVAFDHPRQFKRTEQMRGLLQIQMKSIMPDL